MNEVSRIKVQLEEAHRKKDGQKTLELLELLVNMQVTVMVLQDTHIGATVNKIRKSLDHPEAVALCKKVVKKWKKVAESYKQQSNDTSKTSQNKDITSSATNNNNNGGSSNSNGSIPTNNNANTTSINITDSNSDAAATAAQGDQLTDQKQQQQQQQQSQQAPSTSAEDTAASNTSPKTSKQESTPAAQKPRFVAKEVPQTNSQVRLKFRQMITDALKAPLPKELQSDEPFLDEESLAARMEESIFQEFKSESDSRYRNRIRGRICNLKDKNNPYLRLNVLRGDISAERIAKMTADEMASDELKRQREQFTREAINDHQMALTGGTSSSEIKCPACKKYDCSYNQMQTRSADEPMTTFCHCNNCGKRWKFC